MIFYFRGSGSDETVCVLGEGMLASLQPVTECGPSRSVTIKWAGGDSRRVRIADCSSTLPPGHSGRVIHELHRNDRALNALKKPVDLWITLVPFSGAGERRNNS